MGNLYLLKKSATAEILLDVWNDYLTDDIDRKQKEFSEEEQKWKEPILASLSEYVTLAERDMRNGCLLALIFVPLGALLRIPAAVHARAIAAGGSAVNESASVQYAIKAHNILVNNDIRNALDKLRENNLELPPECMPPTEKLLWMYDLIAFLKEVRALITQAEQVLGDYPEKSEAFAHTYFLLQNENDKSSHLFQNLFEALETLNIASGDLGQRVVPFLSKGGYMDFSIQPYLSEWMNTYKRTHEI